MGIDEEVWSAGIQSLLKVGQYQEILYFCVNRCRVSKDSKDWILGC